LIIVTLPPDRDTLHTIIQAVRPQKVIVFGLDPSLPGKHQIHEAVAKMVNYALNKKNGALNITQMAAVISVTRLEVELVIHGLAAAGKVTILSSGGDQMVIAGGGTPNEDLLRQFETALEYSFNEIIAYRQFFRKSSDLAGLIPPLLRKSR
jgi:hypothetical protein